MSHGQERGVLDRVPAPEAAPAEHLVGPPGPEHDPEREEGQGEEREAAGLDEPALPDPAGDERGDGEGERDREADEAEVEEDRVERRRGGCPAAARSGRRRRAGIAPGVAANGSAGPSISAKKKTDDDEARRAAPTRRRGRSPGRGSGGATTAR